MLSNQIEVTRLALSELGGQVPPAQWCLIRACIEDLGVIAGKAKSVEEALLSGMQVKQEYQHG